jgi:tetratricopeptide (TPR) repeat protein
MNGMKFKRYAILLLILWAQPSLWAQHTEINADTATMQAVPEQPDSVTSNRPASELLKQANELYIGEKYREAIDLYETILREKGRSATLYYNLGNAYYKQNEIAPAILNYERALLRDPGNEDIRFNLEMAKQKTIDKIESIEVFFLVRWINAVRDLYSVDQWSKMGIAMFALFIGCLTMFFFSKKILLKKIGFYAGIVLLAGTVSSNIFAYRQTKKLTEKNTAIITVPTVTIKGSPDNSGIDIVVLHEGSKVFIKSKLGSWNEIVLEDGNVGWIESHKIEII